MSPSPTLMLLLMIVLIVRISHGQCSAFNDDCDLCTAQESCGYCWDSQKCLSGELLAPGNGASCLVNWFFDSCPSCQQHQSCSSCSASGLSCGWCPSNTAKGKPNCVLVKVNSTDCGAPLLHSCACRKHTLCEDCESAPEACSWCVSTQQCESVDVGEQECPGGLSNGVCPACDSFTDCAICNNQPNCVYCAKEGNRGGGPDGASCVEHTQCQAQDSIETCDEQCAAIKGCSGCFQRFSCYWDTKEKTPLCRGRRQGDPFRFACPAPPVQFQGGVFVGGMFVSIGIAAILSIVIFAYRWYQRKRHGGAVIEESVPVRHYY